MGRFSRSSSTGSGSGGSSGALTLLETQTLGATSKTISFSSVSASFADLILVAALRTDDAGNGEFVKLQYGATTVQSGASDYYWHRLVHASSDNVGASAESTAATSIIVPISAGDSAAAGSFNATEWTIHQYANAAIDTTVQIHSVGPEAGQTISGTGGSFAAQAEDIFTISVVTNDFMAGSTAALYGRGTAA